MAKILLISHDGGVREVLSGLLRNRGHELMESPTFGGRAPEWPAEPWDAAFLDLSADAALGLEMVRRARTATPLRRITVIDEGGRDDAFARLARALSDGASEFLSKPIGIPDAGGVLERLGL